MNPLVSVLVPNYNHARFLPQRVESILAQSFKDFEVIALDDASTDNSREVLKRYAQQSPMKLLFNEKNSGNPFKQWQRGAKEASGKYLWIAESDDFADPRLLEVLVSKLESDSRLGLAYCQSFAVDEHNHVSGTWEHWTRSLDAGRWKQDYVNRGSDEVAKYLVRRNTIPNASAVLMRRDLLLEAVEGASRMRLSGDWWTYVRVLLRSDVAFVAEALNYFRSHGRSVRDTTKLSAACVEEFALKAHVCNQISVSRSVRREAFGEVFYKWRMCIDAEGVRGRWPWIKQVHADAVQVYRSATIKMGWVLTKRLLKKIGPVAALARLARRTADGGGVAAVGEAGTSGRPNR